MHEIRFLREHEWPRFRQLYRELVRESSFLIHEPDELSCPRSLPERDLAHSPILIAESARGEWLGYLSFQRGCTRRTLHRGDLSMAVRREHQRSGVGRGLLRRLERWAESAGIRRLELSVIAINEPAIRLYLSENFEHEGVKRNALLVEGLYIDGYFMSKWLSAREPEIQLPTAAGAEYDPLQR
jgi:GNAT superfamily N-acetyltransferase